MASRAWSQIARQQSRNFNRIFKSLVAYTCLQAETAKLLESWHPISPNGESSPRNPSGPLDRSGFSAFVGDPICQPTDRPRLLERRVELHFQTLCWRLKTCPMWSPRVRCGSQLPGPLPKVWASIPRDPAHHHRPRSTRTLTRNRCSRTAKARSQPSGMSGKPPLRPPLPLVWRRLVERVLN